MAKSKNTEQIEKGDIVKRVNCTQMVPQKGDPTLKIRQKITDDATYTVEYIPEDDRLQCLIKNLSNNERLFVSIGGLVLHKPVNVGQIVIARGRELEEMEWFLGRVRKVQKKEVCLVLTNKTEKIIAIKDFDFFSCT